MSELTIAEQNALESIVTKPELQAYFFSKIKKLKWFDEITAKGFLAPSKNPHPITTKDQYIETPGWHALEYLVTTSEHLKQPENRSYAKKFLAVIREVTDSAISEGFSNYRTWWQFSKIIRCIPLDLIDKEDFGRIRFWLGDLFDRSLIGNELGVWLREMLANYVDDDKPHLLSLMSTIFEIKSVKSRYSEEKLEAALFIDDYHAEKLIDAIAYRAGEVIGLDAVELFESKLHSALDIQNNDRWSAIWRPAIEEHEQNRTTYDALAIMVNAVRESMGAFIRNNPGEAGSHLDELVLNESHIKRRIGIYIAASNFKNITEETVSNVVNADNFIDPYLHEMWWFLNWNYSNLIDVYQERVLDAISNISVKDEEGNEREQATAYKKSLWLSSIKEVDACTQALFQQAFDITKTEPDHPDFSSYSSSGSVIHESPIEVTELKVMLQNSEEFIRYLNAYDHVGFLDEPGLEGLVKAFGALITEVFEELPCHLSDFVRLELHFTHQIYTVFSGTWTNKRDVDWELFWTSILVFSATLINEESFWLKSTDQPQGAFVANRHWVIGGLSRLIESGCKNDEHGFPLMCIEPAKEVLEKILVRQKGEDFSVTSDAVSISINSPRGRCLEAYINLALYECRNKRPDSVNHEDIWATYEPIFSGELLRKERNEYEFATLVGNYLLNFRYLSDSWVDRNLPSIFDASNHQGWLCAVQGYSYVGRYDEKAYDYLKTSREFIRILDSEELKDRVEDRYINFIVLGYYYEKEALDDEGSLMGLLLDRNIPEELSAVVWFIWTLRNDEQPRVKAIVNELFPRLLQNITLNTQAGRKRASRLCLWADFFDEFAPDVISWLRTIASYAEEDFNTSHIIEALARLSETDAMEAYHLWMLVLQSRIYDYPDEPIKVIFRNLVDAGPAGKRAAKDIAGRYYTFGTSRPLGWLNEIIESQ
ncbi:hypothetical protein U062_02148 [Gammaproteobacteria bacterium MOLA455]|nr:hypothetical protein U062_02148 [Gammaproteobacteria bacterium MOLA455]